MLEQRDRVVDKQEPGLATGPRRELDGPSVGGHGAGVASGSLLRDGAVRGNVPGADGHGAQGGRVGGRGCRSGDTERQDGEAGSGGRNRRAAGVIAHESSDPRSRRNRKTLTTSRKMPAASGTTSWTSALRRRLNSNNV